MTRNSVIIVVVIAVVAILGIAIVANQSIQQKIAQEKAAMQAKEEAAMQAKKEQAAQELQKKLEKMKQVVVLSEIKKSGESGIATLQGQEDGSLTVTIQTTGFTPDVHQPAHIHVGGCPGVGAVKYPLTSVVNGVSTTKLSVSYDALLKEVPLAINVHKSEKQVSVYTACGDIVATPSASIAPTEVMSSSSATSSPSAQTP